MAMQSWHGTIQTLAADLIFQEIETDSDITLFQNDFFLFLYKHHKHFSCFPNEAQLTLCLKDGIDRIIQFNTIPIR